uniref:Uncharacterized protein n=1 Tax=Mesocestoides corti TaxID=53468 RepID=A0A5K3FXY6_MESCO
MRSLWKVRNWTTHGGCGHVLCRSVGIRSRGSPSMAVKDGQLYTRVAGSFKDIPRSRITVWILLPQHACIHLICHTPVVNRFDPATPASDAECPFSQHVAGRVDPQLPHSREHLSWIILTSRFRR